MLLGKSEHDLQNMKFINHKLSKTCKRQINNLLRAS